MDEADGDERLGPDGSARPEGDDHVENGLSGVRAATEHCATEIGVHALTPNPDSEDLDRVPVDGSAPGEGTDEAAPGAPPEGTAPGQGIAPGEGTDEAAPGPPPDSTAPSEGIAPGDETWKRSRVESSPSAARGDPLQGATGRRDREGVDVYEGGAVSRETERWATEQSATDMESPVKAGPVPSPNGDDGLMAALADSVPSTSDDTPLAQAIANDARRRISLTGRELPAPSATRVMTVANQKGGVGKTTTAVNIAVALAQGGLRVLVVDLDPQGNAGTALGIDHHAGVDSIYEVLVYGKPMEAVVVPSGTDPQLHCAPATIDLAGAEIELVSLVARETRLARALSSYLAGAEYDYVLIDCPPSLGLLTVNALVAAREVFIPIQCEYYALEGLTQLLKSVDMIRTHLNPELAVTTILLTMYDSRTRLSAQVAEDVRSHFPDETLRMAIPRSVRVSEAPSFGETVMTYDPASSGALAYLEAAGEIAARGARFPAKEGAAT